MDLIKAQFDRIQQQLSGLSASQKMLAACLVVIIVMTIGWWGRYAAVADMEPVVDQALSPEELSAVKRQLRASGIPFQVSPEGKVEVPSDRHAEAVADLTFSQALPKSTKLDFQSLVKDINPFAPQSTTDAQFNHYSQMRLAEVISKFPGVSSAEVFVDTTDKPRMGGGVKPTATVSMWMKPGEVVTQHLVDAAGHFIARSHANLSWERVSVVVDGVLRRVRDPQMAAGGGGADYRDSVERFEKDVEERVRQQFSYIPQMTVSVSFKVNTDSTKERSVLYDKDGVIVKPTQETEHNTESTTPSNAPANEPGAQPNTGMTLANTPASVAPAITTENEMKTTNQVFASERVKEVSTPPGMGTPLAAAVHIPRSYVQNVIKEENGDGKDPNKAAIQDRFNLLTTDIRKSVKAVVGLPNEQDVIVSMYTDLAPRTGGAGAGAAGAGFSTASVAAVAGAHSREILLGGLAVVSLFMVSMMVRKGSPLPAAAAPTLPVMPMPLLDASETLAGEVSEGKSTLDAMELDEDAVRAQQMLDQVSSMVEENPDAAAGLVKRWLNRS